MEITLKLRGISESETRCENCGKEPVTMLTDLGLVCSNNCYLNQRVRRAVRHLQFMVTSDRGFARFIQQQVGDLLEDMRQLQCLRPYEMCLECGERLSQLNSQKAPPGAYEAVWRCPVLGCRGGDREIHRLGHPNEDEAP